MALTLYGITTCRTVQKAKDWLKAHDIPFTFFDFKKVALTPQTITQWIGHLGHEKLVNRQSLSWRNLSPEDQKRAQNETTLVNLLVQKPTLIKRPLLEKDSQKPVLGFSEKAYQEFLNE